MKIVRLLIMICIMLVPVSMLHAENTMSVHDAWILEAPPGMKVMAGYLTIRNDTGDTIALTGVSSAQFERVEMHRTIIENDQARMERQKTMAVEAGDTLNFEPGGNHLMLFNPMKSMKKGDEIDLVLIMKDKNTIKVKAQIRRHFEIAR